MTLYVQMGENVLPFVIAMKKLPHCTVNNLSSKIGIYSLPTTATVLVNM